MKDKIQTKGNVRIAAFLWAIMLGLCICSCTKNPKEPKEHKADIISKIKSCSSLVTSEIRYRKIVRFKYDNGNISLNPKTWSIDRVGNAVVVVPFEMKVQYGYDLTDFTADNVKVSDDCTEVWVYLPEPKMIADGYDNSKSYKQMQFITTGFCEKPTNGQIQKVLQKEYEQAIKDLPEMENAKQVEQNAKQLLENILLKMDNQYKIVNIVSINDKK